MRCNVASRIDVANTFGSNFDFQTSDDAVRSDDLAVQVRDPDFVVVDNIDGAHTTAGERFNGIASYAADAEHYDARMRELVHGLFAQQELCSRELFVHVCLQVSRCPGP